MKRPSKKEIQAMVQKLKDSKSSSGEGSSTPFVPKPEGKKPNKNRIRKQGV